MAKKSKAVDVLISHTADGAELAADIARSCRASGLDAVTDAELSPSKNWGDAVWEALAESRALLTVLSRSEPTPQMGIELGAARAWNKPIFVVASDLTITKLPPGLSGVKVYAPSRIDEVIRAIRLSGEDLTEEDRTLLAELYQDLGVSVDQLALEPRQLEELADRFSSAAGKMVSGERLLSELLRMRKQGKMSKERFKERPIRRRGSA